MQLTIRSIPLSDLSPAEYNPRIRMQPGTPDYEQLKQSILTFGNVQPLVWNERTGRLIGGHQRYFIMVDEGQTEADVAVVDLDEEHEKTLNVALNKLQGQWDYTKLQLVVEEIETPHLRGIVLQDEHDMHRIMHAQEAERATDFLGAVDPTIERATVGAPELKDDHPHRTGDQYFTVQVVLNEEQRSVYLRAVNAAKQKYGLNDSFEALTQICHTWLELKT